MSAAGTGSAATRRVAEATFRIVGVEYAKGAAVALHNFRVDRDNFFLVRHEDNEHDPLAVGVWMEGLTGLTRIGYVPRTDNRTVAAAMDAGKEIRMKALRGDFLTVEWDA